MNNPLTTPVLPPPKIEVHWPSVVLAIASMLAIALCTWQKQPIPSAIIGFAGIALQSLFVHDEKNKP